VVAVIYPKEYESVEMEESELIRAANQGDLSAFNNLVLKYQGQIFNHAYRVLGNCDDAEDITQETFILAFRKIYQFRGGSFRAWLFKIATNLCYDEMRYWKRNPYQSWEPVNRDGETNESPYWIKDVRPLPEEAVEMGELREILECSMNKLPSIYRIVLSLIDIQELSYKETASVIGISIGTVKSRLARGRVQLHRILMGMEVSHQRSN